MVCLGLLKPGAAGWKAQTNQLSYGGTLYFFLCCISFVLSLRLRSSFSIMVEILLRFASYLGGSKCFMMGTYQFYYSIYIFPVLEVVTRRDRIIYIERECSILCSS